MEKIVGRNHAAEISNRGLEQAHGRIVLRLREVDLGDIVQNLVDDVALFHDDGSAESIHRTCTPSVSVMVSLGLRLRS